MIDIHLNFSLNFKIQMIFYICQVVYFFRAIANLRRQYYWFILQSYLPDFFEHYLIFTAATISSAKDYG
jgi:hypothetical protein